MKAFLCGAAALFMTFSAQAQGQATAPQQSPPRVTTEGTCASQHVAQPNVSAADLLSQSYDIKAAVPGGLWLQKKQEVFYCNSGLLKDGDTMCWKLRSPLKGQDCGAALSDVKAKDLRS
ncbi:hypothetical protein BH11PSE3_BH11PSE3_15910 [soil metagenome]